MDKKFRARKWPPAISLGALVFLMALRAGAQATASAAPQTPVARVTLDQAVALAVQHNHSLQAARTMILQNQAQEITANLRNFSPFSSRINSAPTISTPAPNSIWASDTCSNAARSASIGCKRPRIRRR